MKTFAYVYPDCKVIVLESSKFDLYENNSVYGRVTGKVNGVNYEAHSVTKAEYEKGCGAHKRLYFEMLKIIISLIEEEGDDNFIYELVMALGIIRSGKVDALYFRTLDNVIKLYRRDVDEDIIRELIVALQKLRACIEKEKLCLANI